VVNLFQGGTNWLDGFLNFEPLLNSFSTVLNDYRPAIYIIAFVLLVVSAMHGFLQPDSRRFFHTIVHSIVLVALICEAPILIGWIEAAAAGFAALPQARVIRVGNENVEFKPGTTPLIKSIEDVLAAKANPVGKIQDQSNVKKGSGGFSFLGFNPGDLLSTMRAWTWQILFGLYLLILLLVKMIILLMTLIQKVIVIGFKLYTPIGVAESAIRTLRGKATSFFLTFIGVLCWPIGWSIVNSVTLAILRMIPAPTDNDPATVIFANVMVVPVLIWIFVGHVVTPIFVQKVVTHGGGVIQGFVGSTFATIGMATAGVNAAFFQGVAKRISGPGGSEANRSQEGGSRPRRSGTQTGEAPVMGVGRKIKNGSRRGSTWQPSDQAREEPLRHKLARPFSFAAGAMARAGAVGGFIGNAVARGSGGGPAGESEALAAIAPPGTYNRSIRQPFRPNRSSERARKYIDRGDRNPAYELDGQKSDF
jgi:hypothetical protein